MSIFDKIIRKSKKSNIELERLAKEKSARFDEDSTRRAKKTDDQPKEKELTIAELQEREIQKEVSPKGRSASGGKKIVRLKKDDTQDAYRILIKPLVTEKGTYLASHNKYLFEVNLETNKYEIKKAVKAVYGVDPVSVRIVNLPGKKVRWKRIPGKTKDRKKAIVTLAKGQHLEIYEGV